MPKRKYLFLLFLFFSCASSAQFWDYQKKFDSTVYYRIYLKDGSFLKAKIEAMEEDVMRLNLETGQVLDMDYKFINATVRLTERQSLLPKGKIIYTKGIYRTISLNVLIGEEERFANGYGFSVASSIAIGYRFYDQLGVGLGLGYSKTDNLLLPVFLDFRGALFKKSISPIYGLQVGYSIPVTIQRLSGAIRYLERNGGLMIQPSIGMRFASKGQTNSILKLGFNFQHDYSIFEHIHWYSSQFGNIIIKDIWHRNLLLKYELLF